MRNPQSSTSCNWDGTDCYFARIYPHIDSLSHHSGSVSGGQELTITGSGFERAMQATVNIDGVDCAVTNITQSTITCITGKKTE